MKYLAMKYLVTLPALCLALAVLTATRAQEVGATVYPVKTVVAGVQVSTRVDTEAARDILLASRSGGDRKIGSRFAGQECRSTADIPIASRQRQWARDYSIDTATALLLRCLTGIPEFHDTQSLFLDEVRARRLQSKRQETYLAAQAGEFLVVMVPGWGYLSNGEETGSNLRRPREIIEQFGYETALVALEDFGSVEGNAAILEKTLRTHLQRDKKIILASASSGGPAVALALEKPDLANHRRLAGWININGVLRGSPLVDRFSGWPKSLFARLVAAFEGWTYRDLLSLGQARSIARFSRFEAPPQLVILNYVGVPFSAQVSRQGRPLYSLLKSAGPNDGLTLITESLAPGYTILAVGSDHFVNQDPEIDLKTAALLPVMLKLVARHGNQLHAAR